VSSIAKFSFVFILRAEEKIVHKITMIMSVMILNCDDYRWRYGLQLNVAVMKLPATKE
jgi:hypothetical protein